MHNVCQYIAHIFVAELLNCRHFLNMVVATRFAATRFCIIVYVSAIQLINYRPTPPSDVTYVCTTCSSTSRLSRAHLIRNFQYLLSRARLFSLFFTICWLQLTYLLHRLMKLFPSCTAESWDIIPTLCNYIFECSLLKIFVFRVLYTFYLRFLNIFSNYNLRFYWLSLMTAKLYVKSHLSLKYQTFTSFCQEDQIYSVVSFFQIASPLALFDIKGVYLSKRDIAHSQFMNCEMKNSLLRNVSYIRDALETGLPYLKMRSTLWRSVLQSFNFFTWDSSLCVISEFHCF